MTAPDATPLRALGGARFGDRLFKALLTVAALAVPVLLGFLIWELWVGSRLAIDAFGFGFFTSSDWDPVEGLFGALPLIFGTVVSSALALLIAVPLSLGVAIFLTEFAPMRIRGPIAFVIELLAAIPSVVYGLWGIFVLIPLLRTTVFPFLRDILGFLPFFQGPIYGPSMLSASIILAITVMPFIMSVAREVLLAVPSSQREAALALGATRWEAVTSAIVPYARSGIIGAVILGLGRALGETMAVTFVIGNFNQLESLSLFEAANSITSALANEFAEAGEGLHQASLIYLGLILFFITFVVLALSKLLLAQLQKNEGTRT